MKPSEITALLHARGFRFRKSLGQNFLLDPNLLRAVADAGEVEAADVIVEVGTGAGTLTAVLAERAARVVTVELDARLAALAREVVGERENVQYVEGDAIKGGTGLHPAIEEAFAAAAREGRPAKCVSNFPYSVATPLFVRLLERSVAERAFPLALIAGTVQREVAERLTATAISKDYGVPSVLLQALAEVAIDRKIGPKAFFPPPKVESAVVRIRPRPPGALPVRDYARFRDLVRAVFQFRRKTVRNALERGLDIAPDVVDNALRQAGVDGKARVETLSCERLAALADATLASP